MRILIFGVTGMLGHAIWLNLRNIYEIFGTIRGELEELSRKCSLFDKNVKKIIEKNEVLSESDLQRALDIAKPDVVVNCVGIVKQLQDAKYPIPSISINALFPHKLAEMCASGLCCLLVAEQKGRYYRIISFVCGVLFALSCVTSQPNVPRFIIFMFCLLFIISPRLRWSPAYSYLVLGMLLVVFIQLGFMWVMAGDPLFDMTISKSYYENYPTEIWADELGVRGWYKGAIKFIHYFYLSPFGCFGIFGYLISIALVFLFIRGSQTRRTKVLILWIFLVIFQVIFGSISLEHYWRLWFVPRYILPCTIPALIICALMFEHVKHKIKYLYRLLIVITVFSSILSLLINSFYNGRKTSEITRIVYGYFNEIKPSQPVYVEQQEGHKLDFFNGYRGNICFKSYTWQNNLSNLKDCYVVIVPESNQMYLANRAPSAVPLEVLYPPPHWILLKQFEQSGKGTGLYRKFLTMVKNNHGLTDQPSLGGLQPPGALIYYVP